MPSSAPRAIRVLDALLRGDDGGALVEMGLIIALFAAPLVTGTAEVAQIAYDAAEIQEAAIAGAKAGMVSATLAGSTSTITSAAQADAPDFGTGLSVSSTPYWVCATSVTGTQYTSQSSATSACGGSGNSLEFLKVTTSETVTLPIHFARLNASYTLTGLSVQEVQQ
jgi:Flp pilus assembly protein TadG